MIDLPLDGFGAAVVAFDDAPPVVGAAVGPTVVFADGPPVGNFVVGGFVGGVTVTFPVEFPFSIASIATQRRTTTATILHIIVPN